jgi:hypothetical protein
MIRVDALRTSGVVVLLTSAFLFCTRVNGQVDEPPALGPLKNVSVPGPRNLSEFVRNREAALALGKALFWDMQVGSDGVLACASCHFHAGVDSRSKNQLSPGLLRVAANRTENPDNAFAAGAPNYQLGPSNFPFHRLRDVNNRDSDVLFDTNDVASSQGAFQSEFVDIVPGSNIDLQVFQPDRVFNVHGTTVRRVEPRHTPSTINAVFNFRQFWDGRAQNIFNGVNPFGLRDQNAFVLKAASPSQLQRVKVKLQDSSLASQAVGPPLSAFEMSGLGRTFPDIGLKLAFYVRLLGKKLSLLTPLGKQQVHPEDSVLGTRSRFPLTGLRTSYASLFKRLSGLSGGIRR